MSEALGWYSIGEDLGPREQPPVALDEALEIARRYYANAEKKFDTAEQGLAATMFGFSRDKDTFIELCVNAPDDISYKFEMPKNPDKKPAWYEKFLSFAFQYETTLKSQGELEGKIREFYTCPAMDIRTVLEAKG
ncbi:MAG: hypothetical protein GC185_13570 [Alphaproteobacteria bacterium]|nr:hypothetical protein [Alphaproteobacteria bacterium]